jgi:TolB protein
LTAKFIYPAFSPDGKKVAFTIAAGTAWDLTVRTLAAGTNKRLTNSSGMNMHPTWSADGTRIAFMSSRTGKNQIFVVPSNGGTQTRITNGSYAETAPAWSH